MPCASRYDSPKRTYSSECDRENLSAVFVYRPRRIKTVTEHLPGLVLCSLSHNLRHAILFLSSQSLTSYERNIEMKALMQPKVSGILWLIARLWLGYEWLNAGLEKVFGDGNAV